MNGQLQPGEILTSAVGVSYKIISMLGSGGQGEVYEVEAAGSRMALKWYYRDKAVPEQKEILQKLISQGAPDSTFLWPEDLVCPANKETFGYIMQLRPRKYKGLNDLLKCRVNPTFYVLCRAAFNLVKEYEKLHALGESYRDINYGNLFFDPDTGDVLICDNDNVAPPNMPCLVRGTYGFMAPEIVRSEALPSRQTDQYSLAVLLFHIFMVAHPLHGKLEDEIHCWDIPAQNWIYGTNPVFIFDPNDDRNRPVKGVHDNALIYWDICPQPLKDLFIESFTVGLKDPKMRVTEHRWMNAIANMMSGIARCPGCGAEVFFDESKAAAGKPHFCWHCKRRVSMPCSLVIGKRRVLLLENAEVRSHQVYGDLDMDTVIGRVVRNPANEAVMGIRNEEKGKNWTYINSKGESKTVVPGRSAGVFAGSKIDFGKKIGVIR